MKVTYIKIGIFALGFLFGAMVLYFSHNDHQVSFSEERFKDDYEFISPLLECDSFESKELESFEEEVNILADTLMQNGTVDDISYYFRDLNNGLWVGINENDKFSPASLMKLPLMMSYFKEAETDPTLMDRTYVFSPLDDNYDRQNIKPVEFMEIGNSYSVQNLINRMIQYSDNSALRILFKNSTTFGYKVFEDLGIELPQNDTEENFMDVRTYSRFFRILYNGSYLNFANSDIALQVLSYTQYKDGIVAGVPEGTIVSHKFGERKIGEEEQLHDCGIVYYPESPYVVCIMTRGNDLTKMSKAIEELSRFTYEEVERNFR